MKKSNMSIIRSAVTAILLAGSAILSGCSGNSTGIKQETTDSPLVVQTAIPASSNFSDGIHASGQVEAIQSANIATRVMGYITKIYVNIGDRVSQGQLLFSINSSDLLAKRAQAEAMIAQADAQLQSSEKDFNRFTALYGQQSASAKELDNATLQYHSAQANAEAARQMLKQVTAELAYTNVKAPFGGVVTQKMLDAGSLATPGTPVLTLEQNKGLQVSASVDESQISNLKEGADALLTIRSAGKSFAGKVTQISQSSQGSGGQYLIKISIPDTQQQNVYAGMYVTVTIPQTDKTPLPADLGEQPVLVPVSSIIRRDQLTGLYTLGSNHTALLRWVRLGKTYGDQVEVLSGLGKAEAFIVQASGRLYNGAPVVARP